MRRQTPHEAPATDGPPTGRLPENILHFGRLLRAAGLRVGPDRMLAALAAVDAVGLARREDLRAALAAVFVSRREDLALFDEAFALFWRDPRLLQRVLGALLEQASGGRPPPQRQPPRRLAEALAAGAPTPGEDEGEQLELGASLTWSGEERLQHRDFAEMGADELAEARRLMSRLRVDIAPMPGRRARIARRGERIDPRASLRAAVRAGDAVALRYRHCRPRPPALVLLLDISGSMGGYARILLQFAHLLTARRPQVHTLLFGTRLTDVTRALRQRDVDAALAACGERAQDWSGGTRIGEALAAFNRCWARRLLPGGAVVLLVSDGLDREGGAGIAAEAARLRRMSRRLIWLNPLLRWEGFAPRAAGMRALLPHVDELRPVHNLRSLEQLAAVLCGRPAAGERHDLRAAARRR